ncbi:DsbA family protein [Kordiimonas pumila]|uniref:DsbA family protein n=1 Tax=Kordiimonas pumila TaxID=2161677 RepID=A0ABV7D1A3_9PROT|nr:DsbA family protein [Kordiimonas pumila]
MKFVFSAVIAALLLSPTTHASEAKILDAEREKIEAVIQNYLMEKPEIIALAIQELQRRQNLAQMLPAIKMYREYLENEQNQPVLGNPDGDVTIVEFFDYRCGYCRRHFQEVMRLVKDDGNVKWVLKHFPILDRPGEPALSRKAALAAIAAGNQGKFAEFHIAMMTGAGAITEEYIFNTARSVGLDIEKLKTDMANKLTDKVINNALSIGQDIGFSGTPGYVIGNDVVLGAEGYERLKSAVARARADNKTKE